MTTKLPFIHDLFTNFEFDKFSNADKIDDSVKLEYIKEMVALAKSDKQAVFMYFGFALGAIAFLIDKIDTFVNKAGFVYLDIFYFGIVMLAASAVFFFTYWRKIHKFQMHIVSCIPLLNIEKTRDLWVRLWNENKRYFKLGLLLLSFGMILIFLMVLISRLLF